MGLIEAGKRRLDVPGESGQWIEVNPLTGPHLDEAKTVKLQKVMDLAGSLDLEKLQSREGPKAKKPKPVDELDAATIVDAAVSGWSYGELGETPPSEQLDAPTFDWLAGEIAEMNTRPPSNAPGSEPT